MLYINHILIHRPTSVFLLISRFSVIRYNTICSKTHFSTAWHHLPFTIHYLFIAHLTCLRHSPALSSLQSPISNHHSPHLGYSPNTPWVFTIWCIQILSSHHALYSLFTSQSHSSIATPLIASLSDDSSTYFISLIAFKILHTSHSHSHSHTPTLTHSHTHHTTHNTTLYTHTLHTHHTTLYTPLHTLHTLHSPLSIPWRFTTQFTITIICQSPFTLKPCQTVHSTITNHIP